jgi:hypothetical protein
MHIARSILLSLGLCASQVVEAAKPSLSWAPGAGCLDANWRYELRAPLSAERPIVICSATEPQGIRLIQDLHGTAFLILVRSEGGGNDTTHYLTVLEPAPPYFELLSTPIGGRAGLFAVWRYSHRVEADSSGGILIHLSLEIEGDDAEVLPRDTTRTIRIGSRAAP